jgi:hypothetical protein
VAEKNDRGATHPNRWVDRLGAALLDPVRAFAVSETKAGQGRAASDLALLLLLAVFAIETQIFVTAGWMLMDGEWAGALTVLVVGAREHLAMPMVVLVLGTVLLTLAAGRRRRPSEDFDLSCVALTPLVALELANSLLLVIGIDAHSALLYVGYAWFAVMLWLALQQTRKRTIR